MSRRLLMKMMAATSVGAGTAVVLAACGETKVVTVEKIVEKEVPVEKIIVKEVPVEKIVIKEISRDVVVERVVEAAPQARTVSFEHISDHTSGPRARAMQWALAKYKEVAPNINVIFTPGSGQIGDTIPIRIAAGTMSESALLDGSFIFNFGPDGVFQPINDILAKHATFDASDYVYLTDQFTADLDLTWPYRTEWDTSTPIYGMPYQHVCGGMSWNIDMFEAAGLDQPQDDWTYGGEFREACRKLTNPDAGEWGTLTTGGKDIHVWMPMAYGMGAKQMLSPDALHTSILDDGGIDGLSLAVDFSLKDQISAPVQDAKELAGEFGNLFYAGKVGMWCRRTDGAGYMMASIKDRFRWAFGPQPKGDVTGTSANHRQDQPHLITDSAFKRGNEKEVVDFLVFMAGPEVQGRAAVDRGFAPVNWEAMAQPSAVAPPPLGMEWIEHALRNYDARRWPKYHPSFAEWLDFRGFLHHAFTGEQTPEEAGEKMEKFADAVLERGQPDFQRVFDYFGGATG